MAKSNQKPRTAFGDALETMIVEKFGKKSHFLRASGLSGMTLNRWQTLWKEIEPGPFKKAADALEKDVGELYSLFYRLREQSKSAPGSPAPAAKTEPPLSKEQMLRLLDRLGTENDARSCWGQFYNADGQWMRITRVFILAFIEQLKISLRAGMARDAAIEAARDAAIKASLGADEADQGLHRTTKFSVSERAPAASARKAHREQRRP